MKIKSYTKIKPIFLLISAFYISSSSSSNTENTNLKLKKNNYKQKNASPSVLAMTPQIQTISADQMTSEIMTTLKNDAGFMQIVTTAQGIPDNNSQKPAVIQNLQTVASFKINSITAKYNIFQNSAEYQQVQQGVYSQINSLVIDTQAPQAAPQKAAQPQQSMLSQIASTGPLAGLYDIANDAAQHKSAGTVAKDVALTPVHAVEGVAKGIGGFFKKIF
jgi:hypothetical protein